ncbi:unnamed protein product [Tenebrio molitor]|nr:unnamed protein product [Tenebrio molitor]
MGEMFTLFSLRILKTLSRLHLFELHISFHQYQFSVFFSWKTYLNNCY